MFPSRKAPEDDKRVRTALGFVWGRQRDGKELNEDRSLSGKKKKKNQLTYHVSTGFPRAGRAEGMRSRSTQDARRSGRTALARGCPFDAGLLREENVCGFFFLLLQPAPGLGSGLGRLGREQKSSSGAAGSHAGSFCKQGNRQKRSSPQTGNSLSLWGGHGKPKPFQTKETKKACAVWR